MNDGEQIPAVNPLGAAGRVGIVAASAVLLKGILGALLRAVALVLCLALLVAAFAVVAAAAFAAGWCCAERERGRTFLESVRAELAAQGEIIEPAGIAAGAPPAAGELRGACAQLRRLAPDCAIGRAWPRCRELLGGGVARVAWRSNSAPVREGSLSWEEVAAQLEKARPAMRDLKAAMARVETSPAGSVPETDTRAAAPWLAWAAIERLHALDNAGALTEIEALVALGQVHRDEPRIETQLWRCAILKGAVRLSWEFLQAPAVDGESIERLAAAWRENRPLGALAAALRRERSRGIEALDTLRRSMEAHLVWEERWPALKAFLAGQRDAIDWKAESQAWARYGAWRLMWADEETAGFLAAFQQVIRRLERTPPRLSWLELRDAWTTAERGMRGRPSLQGWDRMLLDAGALNGGRAACQVLIEFEAERRMLVTAAALLRCQLDRGAPPPRLESLVPGYLPEIPEDPMDARPLRYRLNPFGEPVLYSVGTGGSDDDGDPNRADARPATAVSHGRDMVWPLADFSRAID